MDSTDAQIRAWIAAYGPVVASQLEPARRYSLVRVGDLDFAFTTYDRQCRALAQAWDEGLVPDQRPAALGTDLLERAPRLQGVDCDLIGLTAEAAAPPQQRFAPS